MKRPLLLILLLSLLSLFSFPVYATESNEQLLIINKSLNKMAYYDQGKLIKIFDVATGREINYTPEGIFPIVNKIMDRPYYTDKIPGGDPKNPLGPRWLGLDALNTYGTTYGIHGNNNPDSIGTYASAGCIRMYNDDVIWLFDRIETFTPVVILRSDRSFEQIAKEYEYPLQETKITRERKVITLFEEGITYTEPNPFFIDKKISPQELIAIEHTDNYYHIKDESRDFWIRKDAVVQGGIIQSINLVAIDEATQAFSQPLENREIDQSLTPKLTLSLYQFGDYFLVVEDGEKIWIKAKNNSYPIDQYLIKTFKKDIINYLYLAFIF